MAPCGRCDFCYSLKFWLWFWNPEKQEAAALLSSKFNPQLNGSCLFISSSGSKILSTLVPPPVSRDVQSNSIEDTGLTLLNCTCVKTGSKSGAGTIMKHKSCFCRWSNGRSWLVKEERGSFPCWVWDYKDVIFMSGFSVGLPWNSLINDVSNLQRGLQGIFFCSITVARRSCVLFLRPVITSQKSVLFRSLSLSSAN